MRNAFAEEITALAATDHRIVLLSGDIGNRLFDPFKARFPDRFINVGVAEANMVGIAAGLALGGMRPVTYTIASFAVYRAYEQIRVDVGYHNLPVVMVGTGAGLAYAANGPTHHSCEDVAVLRVIPNMTIACPADADELRALLRDSLQHAGPVYLRIGKKGEPRIHGTVPEMRLGRACVLRPGHDVVLLACGTILSEALDAAELLEEHGVSTEVVSFPTVKPLDEPLLEHVFSARSMIVTVEEHGRAGGLGGAIAEWLTDQPRQKARLLRLGTPDAFLHEAGEQEHARELCGLTAVSIAHAIQSALKPQA
ncbi:MAG TPA: transketolase C-terminal domain-containing protein [Planctomycetaceae bacterium]|nr:transketolase C-terminal domain-containing protein [Planctomycetaceae bacterium]